VTLPPYILYGIFNGKIRNLLYEGVFSYDRFCIFAHKRKCSDKKKIFRQGNIEGRGAIARCHPVPQRDCFTRLRHSWVLKIVENTSNGDDSVPSPLSKIHCLYRNGLLPHVRRHWRESGQGRATCSRPLVLIFCVRDRRRCICNLAPVRALYLLSALKFAYKK